MSKIKKWSRLLWEAQKFPAKYFNPGEQYIYDSGVLPTGITANPGDILTVNAEPWLPAGCIPGKAADWLVIRNSGTTQKMIDEAVTVEPGKVIANLGSESAKFPKTPIPEFFRQLPLKFLLDNYGYGACRKRSQTDPSWTRCGNPFMAISLPFHNGMRRCLVDDDGNVVKYLDATDSSKIEGGETANLTGVEDPENPEKVFGQVMVEIPEVFRYHFVADGIEYVYLCNEDFPVDEHVEKVHIPAGCFYSAYEASLDNRDPESPKICSVVNTSDDFIGGSRDSGQRDWSGDKDLHGRPATYLELGQFRAYARNRGSERWNCDCYFLQLHIYWMFVIEFLTSNTQGVSVIGEGVTTWGSNTWNTFNSYNPFIPCGTTNELGNASGNVKYTLESQNISFFVPSYRGIENPFGHIWSKCDGILVKSANGQNAVYVCDNPGNFSDTLNDDYRLIGYLPTSSNYFLKTIPGLNIPEEDSPTATATTGMCDYFYAPSANAGIMGLLFGGGAINGTESGLSCAYANHAPSHVIANNGSRLCYLNL